MSRPSVTRKIAKWESMQPDVEWQATLECGHVVDGCDTWGVPESTKLEMEKRGTYECYECGEKKDRIRQLESELAELKAPKKSPPPHR
jgi:hypothetical protein